METVFIICATIGGTILVCQTVLSLLGLADHHEIGGHGVALDDHHDVSHHDREQSWFVGILTFRTIVAALTFFGLTGLAASSYGLEPPVVLLAALAAGAGSILLLGAMIRWLANLRAEGNVRIEGAVGRPGTVYLPIPARRLGVGKVTMNLQNRTVEFQAVTAHEELPAGANILVVAIVNSDTVEVAPMNISEDVAHV
jgi:hypothetical protein